jgi:glyoxylase-like metal-dependent hydrolase (beta-lactamase superfamily II)
MVVRSSNDTHKERTIMNTEVYNFKVGAFECLAICDGTLTYAPPIFPPPATLLFGNAPREHLEKTLRQHNIQLEHWVEWVSSYNCLLVNTGEHRVLVDTGAAGAGGLAPNTGRLIQNLKAAGIAPEDIDMVIITHGHPDHIGGIALDDGKLAFPNARYAMWKDEWDFLISKETASEGATPDEEASEEAEAKLGGELENALLGIIRKNLLPIKDRLDLIEGEREILPGILAIAASGHTPGHMALAISSGGEQLLCISDTALHPIQLEQPEWCAVFDVTPDQTVATRRRILNRAATEKALVIAFHFPFPGLGHIVQKGEEWKWQPIV